MKGKLHCGEVSLRKHMLWGCEGIAHSFLTMAVDGVVSNTPDCCTVRHRVSGASWLAAWQPWTLWKTEMSLVNAENGTPFYRNYIPCPWDLVCCSICLRSSSQSENIIFTYEVTIVLQLCYYYYHHHHHHHRRHLSYYFYAEYLQLCMKQTMFLGCCSCSVSTVCAKCNVISPVKCVLYFCIGTSRRMCSVPNMVVFCNSLIVCFPGMLLRYCLGDFEMVPVTRIIRYLYHFRFHIPHALNFYYEASYFKIFSTSFLITCLSPGIAAFSNMQVPCLLSRIMM